MHLNRMNFYYNAKYSQRYLAGEKLKEYVKPKNKKEMSKKLNLVILLTLTER